MFLHVISVEYVGDYKLKIGFNNGVQGIVDLESELYGEIFEPLREIALFQQVFLTGRTIEWPNGADFAPEFLLELLQQRDVSPQQPAAMKPKPGRKATVGKGKKKPVLTGA